MDRAVPHTIVTGGASGIGAAVVDELLARGHAVTVFDLDESPDRRAATERVDLTDETAVAAAVGAALARGGVVTGVVACHGIRGAYVPALEMPLALMRRLYDVHVVGTVSVCREVVRRLGGASASIVLISSTTAYGGWANQIDYGPAKAAIRQVTENLAIEWAPLGVRVNAIAPAHTRTPMLEQLIAGGYDIEAVERRTPLGRLAMPAEMASTICYLLDAATFVTGQCLAVDGGWTAVGK
ncbi:SDR family oxidoreductase [Microbacterium capsulatum]|uniref:SDR family oxidoreductase n=1 Tax=Microbacterium capsulatum TaxID=3041921 RepID=A0ABU0XIX3_9MICO|nr:SDR family oxidoreductase [Microbacterium sp. ASV81]MDQ4213635.1 SDR family oxidoreductase [Microbacterium sp. ASV81]